MKNKMLGDEANETRVLHHVDRLAKELIEITRDLVRIPSLTGEEKAAQSFVRSKMEEIGFEVQSYDKIPARPNLIGTAKTKGSNSSRNKKQFNNLLFIAHIDNIATGNLRDWKYDPYSAEIVGNRIFGRGVSDMKAGLAAMLIAAKAILNSGIQSDGMISIASVVDEEADSSYGMKYLADNNFIKADSVIFGEPAFPCVVTALKGGIWLKLTTFGKKVGSGWPQDGVNAVSKMAKVISEFEKLDIVSGTEEHDLLGKPTIAAGTTIRGGDSLHSIPDICEATVEIYTVPGQTAKDVISKIESLLNNLRRLDTDLSVKVETMFETSPITTNSNERIYLDLQSSIKSVFGRAGKPVGIASMGDARFTKKLGIPTIIAYGPGEKGKGHIVNESVDIQTITSVAKVYALTALRFWKS